MSTKAAGRVYLHFLLLFHWRPGRGYYWGMVVVDGYGYGYMLERPRDCKAKKAREEGRHGGG